jgi:dCMP deaminase
MVDLEDRLSDREFKLRYTIHAEQNCIYNAGRLGNRLIGSTLYVYGLPVCPDCAKGIVQAGIARVIMCYPRGMRPDWEEAFSHSQLLFDEVGIEVSWVDPATLS